MPFTLGVFRKASILRKDTLVRMRKLIISGSELRGYRRMLKRVSAVNPMAGVSGRPYDGVIEMVDGIMSGKDYTVDTCAAGTVSIII